MKNIQNLRVVFVQMLFALAIGQVALRTGDLVNYETSFIKSLQDYHYVYSHMLLCVIILSTSWVGWQISQSSGNTERVNSIFSWPYIVLLIDIFLVISYFIIIRGGEVDVNHHIQSPSAYIETLWSMIIFITYLFWDLITKLRKIRFEQTEDKHYFRKLNFSLNNTAKRSWQTLLCVILSIVIFYIMSPSTNAFKVTIVDFTLISLFLLFRSLKQDMKQVYKLHEDQIPEDLKAEYAFTEYPLVIIDKNIKTKTFVVKWLPWFFLIFFFVWYYLI